MIEREASREGRHDEVNIEGPLDEVVSEVKDDTGFHRVSNMHDRYDEPTSTGVATQKQKKLSPDVEED